MNILFSVVPRIERRKGGESGTRGRGANGDGVPRRPRNEGGRKGKGGLRGRWKFPFFSPTFELIL